MFKTTNVWVLTCFLIWGITANLFAVTTAKIIKKNAALRSESEANARIVAKLQKGETVAVLAVSSNTTDGYPDWFLVRTEHNNIQGWVSTVDLETTQHEDMDLAQLDNMRLSELLPPDAVKYVVAYGAACHFAGEVAYSNEREQEIGKGSQEAASDMAKLQEQIDKEYPPNSNVRKQMELIMRNMENCSDNYIWDDPEKKSDVLNRYYEETAQAFIRAVDWFMLKQDNNTINILRYRDDIFIKRMMNNMDRLPPETQSKVKESIEKLNNYQLSNNEQ